VKLPLFPIALALFCVVGVVVWQIDPGSTASTAHTPVSAPPIRNPADIAEQETSYSETAASQEIEPAQAPPVSDAARPAATPMNELSNQIVSIGDDMDPDDPSTWGLANTQKTISVGEDADPDDPSTWPRDETRMPIQIGEDLDADDPSTWGLNSRTAISVGEDLNPDDLLMWPVEGSDERVSVGDDLDPDAPASWSRE
jgi:hypothetical protein